MSTVLEGSSTTSIWSGGLVTSFTWCVLADNPSPLTGLGTNTWIVSEEDTHTCMIVDPGPDDTGHLERVMDTCHSIDRHIGAVLLTHEHDDHRAGAARLARMGGVPVLSRATSTLPDGSVEVPGLDFEITVVSLPGHSSDSVGFHLPSEGAILTGDVIFADRPTLITWPDGSLASYLESLEVLEALVRNQGVEMFLPGHGLPMDDPLACIERCRRHRFKRLDQVISAVERGVPATADALVRTVYGDVDPRLHKAAAQSANAQLRYAFDNGLLPE